MLPARKNEKPKKNPKKNPNPKVAAATLLVVVLVVVVIAVAGSAASPRRAAHRRYAVRHPRRASGEGATPAESGLGAVPPPDPGRAIARHRATPLSPPLPVACRQARRSAALRAKRQEVGARGEGEGGAGAGGVACRMRGPRSRVVLA